MRASRGAAFQDAARVEDLHAGLEMRPFLPAIRFTSYLLLADHRPAGTLTLAFAAEIRATLRQAVRQWQWPELPTPLPPRIDIHP